MQGKIVKGIAGFYYVYTEDGSLWECKAKGIFRKEKVKPLVGDDVEIIIVDEQERTGNIQRILPRRNELIRPASANIEQALVFFAIAKPEPNLNLLDRFLIMMAQLSMPCIIAFNKQDLEREEDKASDICLNYEKAGYPVYLLSVETGEGVPELLEKLKGKTTALAGPSGVGKSSFLNRVCPGADMETGDISRKVERGKHTTRHSELFALGEKTFLMDTPGFSSLSLFDVDKNELKEYYPEFIRYQEDCRFRGCIHINEPGCSVKKAVSEGEIGKIRYENYCQLYEELKEQAGRRKGYVQKSEKK